MYGRSGIKKQKQEDISFTYILKPFTNVFTRKTIPLANQFYVLEYHFLFWPNASYWNKAIGMKTR